MSLLSSLAASFMMQAAAPPLTKAQMYADFDERVERLEVSSPHLPLKKALWNYDVSAALARLRPTIDSVREDEGFAVLMYRALTTCQDFHTGLMSRPASYEKRRSGYRLFLPLAYMNGEYVMKRAFTKDGQDVPLGSSISRFNGIPVHEYVQSLAPDLVRSYDLSRKRFYADRFYRNFRTFDDSTAAIEFRRPNGSAVTVRLDTRNRMTFTQPILDVFRSGAQYWSESQVLYLRLFEMEEPAMRQVMAGITEHRAKPIRHIIIDVRENQVVATMSGERCWKP